MIERSGSRIDGSRKPAHRQASALLLEQTFTGGHHRISRHQASSHIHDACIILNNRSIDACEAPSGRRGGGVSLRRIECQTRSHRLTTVAASSTSLKRCSTRGSSSMPILRCRWAAWSFLVSRFEQRLHRSKPPQSTGSNFPAGPILPRQDGRRHCTSNRARSAGNAARPAYCSKTRVPGVDGRARRRGGYHQRSLPRFGLLAAAGAGD